jgi:hypothetical protein
MNAYRSPAQLIDLLEIHEGGLTTSTGMVFEVFELRGPDPWHAPETLLNQVDARLCNGADEVPDETLLQVIVCGHNEAGFFERFDAQPFDTREPLRTLRQRRRTFLQQSGLRGARILLAVGARPKKKSRLGKGARAAQRDRIFEQSAAAAKAVCAVLLRAGLRIHKLSESDIRHVFAVGVIPQRLDRNPPLRSGRPPLSEREQLLDADLPARLHPRGDVFAPRPDAFEIMGVHHAAMTMTSMPETTAFGDTAAAIFFQLPTINFRLSFCLYFPKREVAERHNNRGRRLQNAKAQSAGHLTDDKEINKLGYSEALSWELASTSARLVHLGAQMTVWHEDREHLAHLREVIKGQLRRVGYTFVDQHRCHDEQIFKTLPGGMVDAQWVQTTSSAAFAALPIFSLPPGDAPVLAFKNTIGGPFGFHPMSPQRSNANGCVLGASGSGKSFCVNALIAGMLGIDGQVVVVDHAGEDKSGYGLLVELMGERARFISVLSKSGKAHLDPLPHRRFVVEKNGALKSSALARISAVLDLLVSNQGGGKEEGLYRFDLSRAVQAIYTTHEHPTLEDLATHLERGVTELAPQLGKLLRTVTDGAHGHLFAPSTAEPITNLDLVVFDLFGVHELPQNIADAVVYLASHAASDAAFASGDARPSFVIFDEAGELSRNDALGELFGELFATARKWRCGVWAITQAWSSLLQQAPIAADKIRVNAATQIFLSHGADGQAIATVAREWDLTADEQSWMRGLQTVKGQFSELLLRTHITQGKTPVPYSSLITFEPSAFERVLFSSDPVDRLQVQQMRAAYGGSLMDVLNHLTSREGRS